MSDEEYMRLALAEAEAASSAEEVPIGAVVVWNDKVIASAHNRVECDVCGTAHAELLALQAASQVVGDWRLTECTLYVTKEPCAMCAGAMVNCRLGRLVYGCSDERSGAAGGALDITGFAGMLHRVKTTSGVLGEECADVLRRFFRRRRKEEQ